MTRPGASGRKQEVYGETLEGKTCLVRLKNQTRLTREEGRRAAATKRRSNCSRANQKLKKKEGGFRAHKRYKSGKDAAKKLHLARKEMAYLAPALSPERDKNGS